MTSKELLIGIACGIGLAAFLSVGPVAMTLGAALFCGVLAASLVSSSLSIAPRARNRTSGFFAFPTFFGTPHHRSFHPAPRSGVGHTSTFVPASRAFFPSFSMFGHRPTSTVSRSSSFRPASTTSHTSSFRPAPTPTSRTFRAR